LATIPKQACAHLVIHARKEKKAVVKEVTSVVIYKTLQTLFRYCSNFLTVGINGKKPPLSTTFHGYASLP